MTYDVIGDIHGQAGKLTALLDVLGYRVRNGAYRHPQCRIAVFVGDLIDRGPGQLEVLEIVRRMRDAGSAMVVMGNHELNAIGYATLGSDGKSYLRPRVQKNVDQHRAFLDQVGCDTPRHREWIDWFLTLPVAFDRGGIRVCHAWWDNERIAVAAASGEDGAIGRSIVEASFEKGSTAHEVLEGLTKGLEVKLPEGCGFTDHSGVVRHKARIRWWDEDADTFRSGAIVPDDQQHAMPDAPLPAGLPPGNHSEVPVFVGHYWLTGPPRIQNRNTAVLDFGAGAHGPLVAYRWEGESALRDDGIVTAG